MRRQKESRQYIKHEQHITTFSHLSFACQFVYKHRLRQKGVLPSG